VIVTRFRFDQTNDMANPTNTAPDQRQTEAPSSARGIGSEFSRLLDCHCESIGDATLYCCDCLRLMRKMPDNSIDAIITDPPYFKVKGEEWDNQWERPQEFLVWIGDLTAEFERLLKPNGSLYFFASHQMAARVEVEISKRLNILNNITWRKGRSGMKAQGWGQKAEKEALRAFIPETEKIIFAEHYKSDNIAKGEAGYIAKCDELRGFVFESLREYLAQEVKRSGWKLADLNAAMGFAPRGMVETRYFGRSQWQLPTEKHYKKMRQILGHEFLRREYEDLRREYEDLRRPFNVTARDQWGDVWEFDPVRGYPGKHPCEKPLPLLMHMLKASTRIGNVVFDPFMGGGSMGHACHEMGRIFIGSESCRENFKKARQRISQAQAQGRLAI
jgi:adenine-specific DNA-methyltransferase